MKPLEGCAHVCSSPCHTGPCPPCSIRLVRPCRCGSTTREVLCSVDLAAARARARGEAGSDTEILCERPCNALRACGRHQCNRPCCPLASLASLVKGKGKKKAVDNLEDPEGWHECDLVCGKLLNCGNHSCEERDHKGVCPPCLRSSFEEVCCVSLQLTFVGCLFTLSSDRLPLRAHCPRPPDPMWYEDGVRIPLFSPPTSVRASEGVACVPRRPDSLPTMPISDDQAVRLWKEDGR